MRRPVLSSISSQWEALDADKVNAIVQLEEDAKACLCKNRMRSFESNVITRDISDGFRKPVCRQKFLDGKMRELTDSRITVHDCRDEGRACRHHCFFLIFPTPART